jgi:hypothetical protein
MNIPAAGMSFDELFRHLFLTVLASVHKMTNAGGSLRAVGFHMIVVTFHISKKKSMAMRKFDGGPVWSTSGIG